MKLVFNFFLYISLILLTSVVSANDRVIDSLQQLFVHEESPETKVDLLLDLVKHGYHYAPEAINPTREAMDLVDKHKLDDHRGLVNNFFGIIYYSQGNYELALEYFHKVYTIASKTEDKDLTNRALSNIALVNLQLQNYKRAEEYYNKIIEKAEQENDSLLMYHTYNYLGAVHLEINELREAVRYLKKSYQLAIVCATEYDKMVSLNNIGNGYMSLNMLDSASFYFNQSYKLSNEAAGNQFNGVLLMNMANVENERGNPEAAMHYIKRSEELLAEIEALGFLETAIAIKTSIFDSLGLYQEAYQAQKQLKEITDTLHFRARKTAIEETEAKFELKLKEEEITLLEHEKVQQSKILTYQRISMLVGGLALFWILTYAIGQYRSRKRLHKLNNKLLEQNELIERQKLELWELNANKDRFFSIIAHDLRNPFNSMLGFLDIMIIRKSLPKEKLDRYLNAMHDTAKSTYKLLQNLLLWANHQMSTDKFNPKEENINKLIDEELGHLKNLASDKKVDIFNEVEAETTYSLDKPMISFVIRNLISNAIKFSREGDTIHIGAQPENGSIRFWIEDMGIGIPDDIAGELFNPSVKTTTPGTGQESGTGLGLPLCKEFVAKHNGKIWFESEINSGTTFYFTLHQN